VEEAAEISRKKGIETGFSVFKRIGSENFYLSPVFEGTKESYEREEIYPDKSSYPIIETHFHPTRYKRKIGGPLPHPSPYDLELISRIKKETAQRYKISTNPIMVVATPWSPWSEKEIVLLLIQEKTDKPISHGKIRTFHRYLHKVAGCCDDCVLRIYNEFMESNLYNLKLLRFRQNKYDKPEKFSTFSVYEKRLK
jgi:hypothetical protein